MINFTLEKANLFTCFPIFRQKYFESLDAFQRQLNIFFHIWQAQTLLSAILTREEIEIIKSVIYCLMRSLFFSWFHTSVSLCSAVKLQGHETPIAKKGILIKLICS